MAKEILTGRNIYLDKRNRTVYYDIITKNGYVIPKEEEKKIFFYKNRLPLILVAAILSIDTIFDVTLATIVGIAVFVVVEFYYRFFIFKKLKISSSFDREKKKSLIQSIVDKNERGKSFILIALYIAFAILIVINAYRQDYSIWLTLLSYGFALFALYNVIAHIFAIIKMKK